MNINNDYDPNCFSVISMYISHTFFHNLHLVILPVSYFLRNTAVTLYVSHTKKYSVQCDLIIISHISILSNGNFICYSVMDMFAVDPSCLSASVIEIRLNVNK